MKIISLFNNKGGVGKTTLAYHLACALATMNKKVLMIDLDAQCNLTIFAIDVESLHNIWQKEDDYIEDYESALKTKSNLKELMGDVRTIHFLLKPTEDGYSSSNELSTPYIINKNLHLIPGRLTIHQFENKIAERWSGAFQGDPLSLRTITDIRHICEEYGKSEGYDYIIIDTSPSLSALNKVIISTVDGFIIPCQPDMFSLYGIRNIGDSLDRWQKELTTLFNLISAAKREKFPEKFVKFLGYTIYNAKKYAGASKWDLATAHNHFAEQIPETISKYIKRELMCGIPPRIMAEPIGGTAVMHTHNTLPNMAQKYKLPIWKIPNCSRLELSDKNTVIPNRKHYEQTEGQYIKFASDLIKRMEYIDDIN